MLKNSKTVSIIKGLVIAFLALACVLMVGDIIRDDGDVFDEEAFLHEQDMYNELAG